MNDNELIKLYIDTLKGLIEIDVVYGGKQDILLRGNVNPLVPVTELEIASRLQHLPGKAEIITLSPRTVIRLRIPGAIPKRKIPWLNLGLFILTLITTLLVGAAEAGLDYISNPTVFWTDPLLIIQAGGPFSFSLLTILLFHEFGHYTASRLHGVKVTLPYFIPFPNFLGTMGAIIRLKSPFISRKQLFDVGATGPLAGMFIAIPITIWGMHHPTFIPDTANMEGMIFLGDSLLYTFLAHLFQPLPPEGYMTIVSPMAFAGWVGMFVTMLNLLPIGQMDGGHVVYAMFGKFQHKIAYAILALMVILSYWWLGWLIWAFFGLILIKAKHPPTMLDEIPLDKKRLAIGYLCIAIFILCFMPIPIQGF